MLLIIVLTWCTSILYRFVCVYGCSMLACKSVSYHIYVVVGSLQIANLWQSLPPSQTQTHTQKHTNTNTHQHTYLRRLFMEPNHIISSTNTTTYTNMHTQYPIAFWCLDVVRVRVNPLYALDNTHTNTKHNTTTTHTRPHSA